MKGMYITRHNEAVWIILRSLLTGRLGASVVMHDAGHQQDTSELRLLHAADWGPSQEDTIADRMYPDSTDGELQQQRTRIGTRIPEWIYDTPIGPIQDKVEWDRYRPDILIATAGSPSDGDKIEQFRSRSLHIVEVKYCRDTDRNVQSLRAEQQHQGLRDALVRIGYESDQVHMHVITLGATGTIYKDTHSTLTALGLDSKAAVKRCCADLHKHAVRYVMKLLKTKWAQEYANNKHGAG